MEDNIIGKRIREARGDLTLREFSKKCGISHTHIDSIERGMDPRTGKRVEVRVATVIKLCAVTGYSMDYFLGSTDDPHSGYGFFDMSGNLIRKSQEEKPKEEKSSEHDARVDELRPAKSAGQSKPRQSKKANLVQQATGKSDSPQPTPLNIPESLQGAKVGFHRSEFEELTQDEVDALAKIAETLKSARRKANA